MIDTGCETFRPILRHPTRDVLTENTAQQILAHNEAGGRRCGWQPTKPTTAK